MALVWIRSGAAFDCSPVCLLMGNHSRKFHGTWKSLRWWISLGVGGVAEPSLCSKETTLVSWLPPHSRLLLKMGCMINLKMQYAITIIKLSFFFCPKFTAKNRFAGVPYKALKPIGVRFKGLGMWVESLKPKEWELTAMHVTMPSQNSEMPWHLCKTLLV